MKRTKRKKLKNTRNSVQRRTTTDSTIQHWFGLNVCVACCMRCHARGQHADAHSIHVVYVYSIYSSSEQRTLLRSIKREYGCCVAGSGMRRGRANHCRAATARARWMDGWMDDDGGSGGRTCVCLRASPRWSPICLCVCMEVPASLPLLSVS